MELYLEYAPFPTDGFINICFFIVFNAMVRPKLCSKMLKNTNSLTDSSHTENALFVGWKWIVSTNRVDGDSPDQVAVEAVQVDQVDQVDQAEGADSLAGFAASMRQDMCHSS